MSITAIIPVAQMQAANAALEAQGFGPPQLQCARLRRDRRKATAMR